HDIVISISFISFFGYEIDLLTITALLTIAGYSINDTIIIYDRIREISPKMHKSSLAEIINKATNETFSRTIITSFTVIITVVAIYLLGGEALKGFSFTLLVGFISGIYSTVYIAAPMVLFFRKSRV
ncbi:MAG: protein translocase subunit SecF, partial [Candidatus Omnitrophica bacterium]|nr:protein translocase subunit SecF [Candidatus Omnitrophota bacterium]